MNLGIIKKKGEDMENVLNISKVVVECNHCKSEIRFDINSSINMKTPYACPMCGSLYGIDPEDDAMVRVRELMRSVKSTKGATFSFLCEDE